VSSVRLGIIGTGLATEKLHWPALVQMRDRFEIVAFSNHTQPKAEAFAELSGLSMDGYHADYHELLARDDVDAVLICLPIPLLYASTRAALEAGKHVLCEKPSGANLEEGRAFLQLSGRYPRLKVLVGENHFYRDDFRFARSLIDDGVLGQIHLLTMRAFSQSEPSLGSYAATRWRQEPGHRGGFHLDGGVHHVAQMRLYVGDVSTIHAFVQDANPAMGGPSDLVANVHFVNDAIGSYAAAYLPIATPDEPNGMRLYGRQGIASWRGFRLRVTGADGRGVEHVFETDGGYYNQLLNFYEAIQYDEPIVGTIEQSFANLEVVMRALDSAESGKEVAVTEVPGGARAPAVPLWRPRGASGLFDGLPCIYRQETMP
jgi:predicted dehydrogenase